MTPKLSPMTTTLITGANKGLGRETARRLIELGHTVYLGCRDAGRGQQAAADLGGVPLLVDVTSDASVAAAAAQIRERAGLLDVLVNNAGVAGGLRPAADTTAADMLAVYDTNVFGVVRMLQAFLPLLERSLGSLAVTRDPGRFESTLKGLAYPSSKSALNMLTSQYAKSFPKLRINAVDPGYTATDLNGHRGTQSIGQGAEIIVRMANLGHDGPSGTFVDVNGTVPW